MLPIADFGLGEAIVTVLMIFLIFIFIWVLITILTDLFRDHEISGWAKAAWCFLLIFFPYITAFVYLIARGKGMRERAIAQQVELQQATDKYIRQVASSSPADEIAKLHELQTKGAITEEEFTRLKAKIA